MAKNHLVIGLGGTGGKILRSFRKTIYQNFRSEDPTGVNIRYLYVDSSNEMMANDDPSWKILGHNVQLQQNSQLKIAGMNLTAVLKNLGAYPGISPWLGDQEQFSSILNAADAANVIGGQKRRLGRFLFACQVAAFRRQVTELVGGMQIGGTNETTFHICCGLAGGTGSGCVVDVVSQIRSIYATSGAASYRIIVYAFVPEQNPKPQRSTGNYHANGYAALIELNALSTGVYKPHDVSGLTIDPAGRGAARLDLQDPFNCCYLFSDSNEDGNRVDVDSELPEIVSSFLYQKIVAVKDMSWSYLERLEKLENSANGSSPEQTAAGRGERSRLFFTFGIKQIAYPEEEIREYLTYSFARQAALQLQFNSWSDSVGYTEQATTQSFNSFVKQKDTLERWKITDEHLSLSEGVLQDEARNKTWKPISQFWMSFVDNMKIEVRADHARQERVWLDQLSAKSETGFTESYRGEGVLRFYDTKRKEMPDHALKLRRGIEEDLFNQWRDGVQSMQDISRILAALRESLDDRRKGMDETVSKTKENVESGEKKVKDAKTDWTRIGFIAEWMGQRDKIFDKQAESLKELYAYRTRLQGWLFAKELLQALVTEISDLGNEVAKCAGVISEATQRFTDGVNSRCADTGKEDLTKQVVRFYKPSAIKEFAKLLERDKPEQQKQTAAVRAGLTELLGETQSFATFNNRLPTNKFIDTLELICQKKSADAHNTFIASNRNRSPILQVSVIDRLFREYGGNHEALRGYILGVVSRARNYLRMNPAEVQAVGPGIPHHTQACMSCFTVILPEAPELPDFRETLRTEFENAKTGVKEIVTNNRKPNEITLINITNLFPIRFVSDVGFLRQEYDRRRADPLATMELHGEGDGSQFPNLFAPVVGAAEVFPYMLIAQAVNVLQTLDDPETGATGVYMIVKDERGREKDPLLLGRTFIDAVNGLSAEMLGKVQQALQTLLDGEFRHKTKRQQLAASIQSEVDKIRGERKNPLDRVFRQYSNGLDKAEAILLEER